jgi:hypothetical protein
MLARRSFFAVVVMLASLFSFGVQTTTANDYYNHISGVPATGSLASSATMRAEFDSIVTGFNKLPTITGNLNEAIFVNSTGTVLEAVSASDARTRLGGPIVKRKTADESVTSSTTLQNDDHLSFSIAASEEWVVTLYLDVGNDITTTGVIASITAPAGATLNIVATSCSSTATACISARTTTSGATLTLSQNGTSNHIAMTVWVLNSSTAGTIQLQWAQGSSSGTALTMKKGSYAIAHKVV